MSDGELHPERVGGPHPRAKTSWFRGRFVRWRVLAVLVALAALAGYVIVDALRFDDPAARIDLSTPATSELLVPPLQQASYVDGVAQFELSIGPSEHEFMTGTSTNTIAYNDMAILGPTLEVRTGETVQIDVTNGLDTVTTTHWHGADVPAAADGGPHSTIAPNNTWSAQFEVIQPAATLWYHPHRMDVTAEQVYFGGAGLMIVRDDNPLAADLPATYGVDDIPVVLQDRSFTETGQLDFALDDAGRGRHMDTLTVNGTIDPYVEVPSGLVRLRILNGSQARVYQLSAAGSSLHQIASDGGYLEQPVAVNRVAVSPGDRAELILEVGDEPVALVDAAFGRVLELRPNGETSTNTRMPEQLTTIERFSAEDVDVDRSFLMHQVGDHWAINGSAMDMAVVNEVIRFGDTERWTITVDNGQHAFHVHQTQFQVVSINGQPPPPQERGWEDTVWVNGDREVVIIARFDTYANPEIPYMFHCHILDHEDLGMMGQFKVIE